MDFVGLIFIFLEDVVHSCLADVKIANYCASTCLRVGSNGGENSVRIRVFSRPSISRRPCKVAVRECVPVNTGEEPPIRVVPLRITVCVYPRSFTIKTALLIPLRYFIHNSSHVKIFWVCQIVRHVQEHTSNHQSRKSTETCTADRKAHRAFENIRASSNGTCTCYGNARTLAGDKRTGRGARGVDGKTSQPALPSFPQPPLNYKSNVQHTVNMGPFDQ